MLQVIKDQLNQSYPGDLVDSLLESYKELVENFNRGKLRPSEVEAGRFCEAAIRILQYKIAKTYTPLGDRLNMDMEINNLANLSKANFDDSIRLHIPRTIRVVYDIRNKRDSAHLGNINTNIMDATLVLNCCKWILAELFRIDLKMPINKAQQTIDHLIKRNVPTVQDFGGFLVTLDSGLSARHRILVLLYHRGEQGATREEVASWLPPKMKKQLASVLNRLQHDSNYIHRDGNRIYITIAGEQFIEQRILPNL